MGGSGIFDLEKNFAFYAAYHNHRINVLIHMLFVWPILFTLGVLFAYTKPLVPQLPFMAALPFHEYMVLNWSFVAGCVYAFFYIAMEPKLGSWAALLVMFCWIGANAVAQQIPFASGWKIVAASQCFCWSLQFLGHGLFEKRAPSLMDNFVVTFMMAPYFVLLEILVKAIDFEPYPGFSKSVQGKTLAHIAQFRAGQAKAKHMN